MFFPVSVCGLDSFAEFLLGLGTPVCVRQPEAIFSRSGNPYFSPSQWICCHTIFPLGGGGEVRGGDETGEGEEGGGGGGEGGDGYDVLTDVLNRA